MPCLSPGMELPMRVPQAGCGHVGVDFGSADFRVAQQFLNDPQIRAVLEQVRGKTVSEHMRSNVALDAGAADPVLDPQP